jgi:hypothetical protein
VPGSHSSRRPPDISGRAKEYAPRTFRCFRMKGLARARPCSPGSRDHLATRVGRNPPGLAQFAAFQAYRDLPASTRSVGKAAEAIGKSPKTLYGWSAQYD